jgi:hypothetical protein
LLTVPAGPAPLKPFPFSTSSISSPSVQTPDDARLSSLPPFAHSPWQEDADTQ